LPIDYAIAVPARAAERRHNRWAILDRGRGFKRVEESSMAQYPDEKKGRGEDPDTRTASTKSFLR